ncbi:thiopeptide-type bacteriocin biosynthesis protein [Pseudofrankia asymbiotica]|uniref:Thiopeptide-type bacteriocin biosynthesis domain-containing protein n=1 Tax=Pseudofrankia asymbiotica TaxID=1834516 RepID=A0A1V2HZ50_9ACTN|nr:thiopeptide-type bacteriocin biosynthesis protein [Pseudofrankia asymbiotica]ONH22028.1 hypothetical protein BL253_36960 [Pseudofrankia asymbiotica]
MSEDLPDVAAHSGLPVADLQAALGVCHAGGKAALQDRSASSWCGVRITFADQDQAEQTMATLVGPAPDTLRTGSQFGWWFARGHPAWSLYLHRADPLAVRRLFRNLTRMRDLAATVPEIYKPDPRPFGGLTGTEITHDLFRADSEAILSQIRRDDPPLRRPELSAMLLDTLLTAARLDWPAHRNLYARLAHARRTVDHVAVRRLGAQLLTVLTTPAHDRAPFAAPWSDAYATTGSRLADAADKDLLTYRLADVLSKIVTSQWDRLGLAAATQTTLARAATHIYLPHG